MSDPLNGKKLDGTFAPGWKGGGRPKMPEELKKAFQDRTKDALDTLVDVMKNSDRGSDRVKAAEAILDRSWGRPVQQIDANVNDGSTVIDTSKLSSEKLAVLAELAIESLGEDATNN